MIVTKISETKYSVKGGGLMAYTVNLLHNECRGSCGCGQFTFRVYPKWRRSEPSVPCKHILVAVSHYIREHSPVVTPETALETSEVIESVNTPTQHQRPLQDATA